MNQDILLSKIVPNPTDTTWSQAYTTLNVYMTVSLEKTDSKTPVTNYGKELLEKLQREFFALDEKNLDNIKKAVANALRHISEEYEYSVIVGAIVGDILYIVIASEGQVIIKRKGKIGIVATGIKNELHGFSGKLAHDDIIILETGDFNKKIPASNIAEQLESNDVLKIAEDITPLIHDGSKGTESAIILQFKDHSAENKDALAEAQSLEDAEENDETETIERIAIRENKSFDEENLWTKPAKEVEPEEEVYKNQSTQIDESEPNRKKFSIPSLSFIPKLSIKDKRIIIIGIILLLLIVLVAGISYQTTRSNQAKVGSEFAAVFDPIKNKYDEALEYVGLNQTLAFEGLTDALDMAKKALAKYNETSSEYKQLSNFISQIESKIAEFGGGGSAKNIEEFLKTNDQIKSITAITAKGGDLLLLDSAGKQVAIIQDDGSIGKTYDIETEADFISADNNYIYVMGKTVVSIDRGNGSVREIMDNINGSSFDIFGSNLYILNNNDILKYRPPAYEGVSYFTKDPVFPSSPVDFSISGPIYVLLSNGEIERYTRGERDDFQLSGLTAPIGKGGKIYADPDLDNFYVMDVKNQRIVSFDKEGDYITQYEGSFIKDATSFAIDEENQKGYVVKSNTVYSFDL